MKSIVSSEHKTPVLLFFRVLGILNVDTFLLLCILGGSGRACQYAARLWSFGQRATKFNLRSFLHSGVEGGWGLLRVLAKSNDPTLILSRIGHLHI